MKMSGVMLGTRDSKKLAEFYTKVLGEPSWYQDDWYVYGDKNVYVTIGPHSEVSDRSSEPQRIMISFDVEDVKVEFARLTTLGAEIVAEPYQPDMVEDSGTWIATVADPDGNYIQVMTPWEEPSK